jgi:hypothetical protein
LFYRQFEAEIKQTTLNWRIYDLVEKGILERIGKGEFRIGRNQVFIPDVNTKLKTLHNKIINEFPFIEFCVWNTSVLNEFSLHQSNKSFTLIEVERDSAESVFLALKEHGNKIFFNPSSDILEQYIFEISHPIIVKFLVSEAPTQRVKNYNMVTLEKILVDLFCEEELFSIYQGKERGTIFKEAFNKYTINNTKLLRYASRRGKRQEFAKYLNQIIGKI